MKRPKTAPKKPDTAKALDLSIEFKDFGPISRGTIALKPLTVLIGANNAGKSYAAMLVHAVLKTWHEVADPSNAPRWWADIFYAVEGFFDDLDNSFSGIEETLRSSEKKDFEMPPEIVVQIYANILRATYTDEDSVFSQQIKHAYACPLQELIRSGQKAFELNITSQGYGVQLKSYKQGTQYLLKMQPWSATWDAKIRELAGDIEREVKQNLDNDAKCRDMMEHGLRNDFTSIVQGLTIRSRYLPAARSGLMQGYKAIVANLIQRTSYPGKAEGLRFSGVIADFLTTLVASPQFYSGGARFVTDIEEELLHGTIEMDVGTGQASQLPEIYYRQNGLAMPLYRTSSTISELAPLFVYLKQIIPPGELLIIEEPEAHLHPANQRILAKLLVRLIRRGVYVLITTHSEFLLEQLNNFLQLSKITSPRRSERYKYAQKDYLTNAEVAAYEFKYDRKSQGHIIRKIDVTAEDGISEEEFTAVAEALYDETVQLHREVSEMAG